ncbi:MAG: hypothetical protein ACRDJH_23235 [Thermomicrobiales bacterium]
MNARGIGRCGEGCLKTRHIAIATIARAAAAIGYLATMKTDMAIVKSNTDDVILLGYPLNRDPTATHRIGALIHISSGAVLGAAYVTGACRFLPGPGWLRGVIFANVENAVLYLLTQFESRHPAI